MANLYSEIRDTIKTGDLLIWKTTKINSLIDFILYLYQKIFKAKFTHVGVAVALGNRVLLVEATPPVVRLYPLSLLDDFYLLKTDITYKNKHLDILFEDLGKKYSLIDLIKYLFKIGRSNNHYYCSKLASKFYNEIGLIDDEDAGLTPDSIVEAVKKATSSAITFVKIDRGNIDVI